MSAVAMMKDEDQPPETPQAPPRREPEYDLAIEHAIDRIRKRSLQDAQAATESACFGEMWYTPTDGQCPLDGTNGNDKCPLRHDCEGAYTEAQARIHDRSLLRQPVAAPAPPPVAPAPPVVVPEPVAAPQVADKVAPKEKARRPRKNAPAVPVPGKWAGTGKYQRTGYQTQNRPVDKALAQLVEILGNPATLPTVWNPTDFQMKYGHLGKLVLSRTASYTTIIVDGQTVMRCWTNANNCMLIDIVDQLIKPMQVIKGISKIYPVPPKSERKLRPCTHRFELSFATTAHSEAIGAIGGFVRMFYSV